MNATDDTKFVQALLVLGEVFNEQISEMRMEAYRMALADYDMAAIERACKSAMTSLKFFPKPVELIELIEGNAEDRANQAWGTLYAATTDSGYSSVRFLDPAAAVAVDAVFQGWIQACQVLSQCSSEMLAHYRNHFIKQYVAARRNRRDVETYRPGLSELSMRVDGEWKTRMQRAIVQPVLLIGIRETRRLMMPFDVQTGTLRADAQAALTAGVDAAQQFARQFAGKPMLPPAPLKALSAAPATEDEKREILAEVRSQFAANPNATAYLNALEKVA